MKFIIVLGLILTVSNIFTIGQLAAAGIFCSIVVPTVNVTFGKKYGIPLAVVGFVITLVMYFN